MESTWFLPKMPKIKLKHQFCEGSIHWLLYIYVVGGHISVGMLWLYWLKLCLSLSRIYGCMAMWQCDCTLSSKQWLAGHIQCGLAVSPGQHSTVTQRERRSTAFMVISNPVHQSPPLSPPLSRIVTAVFLVSRFPPSSLHPKYTTHLSHSISGLQLQALHSAVLRQGLAQYGNCNSPTIQQINFCWEMRLYEQAISNG